MSLPFWVGEWGIKFINSKLKFFTSLDQLWSTFFNKEKWTLHGELRLQNFQFEMCNCTPFPKKLLMKNLEIFTVGFNFNYSKDILNLRPGMAPYEND